MSQPEVNLQQAKRHQELLNEILSSLDQVLEFNPKTGSLKPWAWWVFFSLIRRGSVFSLYIYTWLKLVSDRPKNKEFNGGRLPVCYFAGYRATHHLVFPCCLCAKFLGDVTESAVYIASTGPYRGFWVASCAQDLCDFTGEYAVLYKIMNKRLLRHSITWLFFQQGQHSGRGLSKS